MCGIGGIISNKAKDLSNIVPMLNIIKHRGPDDSGIVLFAKIAEKLSAHKETKDYKSAAVALGHNRLSIVDTSSLGHQPMFDANLKYCIVFNGEIYNYAELKNILLNEGYKFNTRCDTELIMAAYDFWGVRCLEFFNGMWAFVIFNIESGKFFISRDRFGEKPLYYCKFDGSFYFSSEIKSFSKIDGLHLRPRTKYIRKYLIEGCEQWSKDTAFEDIFRFPHSSYVEVTADEIMRNLLPIKYWDVSPNISKEKFSKQKAENYAKNYYELLKDSIRLRIPSEVNYGISLSGGLDSSSIAFLINEIRLESADDSRKMKSYSTVYKKSNYQDCDESEEISTVANNLNIKQHIIEPSANSVPVLLKEVIWATENPPETILISSWSVYKLAYSDGCKVLIEGQGADELLAGYDFYLSEYFASLNYIEILQQLKPYLKVANYRKWVLKGVLIKLSTTLFGKIVIKKLIKLIFNREFYYNLNLSLKVQSNTSLVTLLQYADRCSMANSIESRLPFLDHRLVEYIASIPSVYKIHGGYNKYIARLAFNGKLPDKICWSNSKKGWNIPQNQWFSNSLMLWMEKELNYFSFEFKNLSKIIFFRKKNALNRRVRKLNLSLWDKIFFKN